MTSAVQKERSILAGILFLHLLSHLYGITDPPNGYHTWRESDTAAVAEAFYRESKNIFEPRTHQRKDKIGITGMEFPVYNYITGLLYHVFGFRHLVPRLLSVFIGISGLWGIYKLSKLYLHGKGALLAVYLTACSPLFFFYTRKIQPDIIILTATVWALYFFIKAEMQNSNKYLIFSLTLLVLAALIKPIALAVGWPMIAYLFHHRFRGKLSNVVKPKYILFLIISVVIPLSWNIYARYLSVKYDLQIYYLGGDQIQYWLNTNWVDFFKKVYRTWLFEIFLGIPISIGLIVGVLYLRKIEKPITLFLWWVFGCYLMFFVVSDHMSNHHDYYGLMVIPPFMVLSAYYLQHLLTSGKKILSIFTMLILFSAAVYIWPRINQRYDDYSEKDFVATRKLIDKYIPKNTRVTVEDSTPAIQLYRVGRFGWRFPKNVDAELLLEQHREGAQYAIFFGHQSPLAILREQMDIVYHGSQITICKFKID